MSNKKNNQNSPAGLSDFEKLQLVHEYIKYLIADELLPINKNELKIAFSTFKYDKTDADIIYKYIVDLYGYNGFPQIVTDTYYKRLQKPEIFRSADTFDHLANTLVDFDMHYGWGFAANGLYFDSNKLRAAEYHANLPKADWANNEEKKNEVLSRVLKVKLNSYKIINIQYIKSELKKSINGKLTTNEIFREKMETLTSFLSTITYDKIFDEKLFIHMLLNDPAKLCVILGIDALNVKNEFHPISTVVLNRAKLTVSKSEFNRICENSNFYKDFAITEESQPNNEG